MILLRADGNKKVGSGHIMRCLSIADAARKQGEDCCFVAADNTGVPLVRDRSFDCQVLNTDYTNLQSEIDSFVQIIEQLAPSHIIVDSYYVTKEYLKKIGQYANILYIDDRAEFAYPVDILVNYNIYGPNLNYPKLYQDEQIVLPELLLGPQYTPLRDEFQNVLSKCSPQKSRMF
jgi:spore coat polysaccharide biosynthesis predicted glycosyltransferase SpsG